MVPRAFWLSLLVCGASLAGLVALRVYMPHDPGLRVHYSTAFTGWGALADAGRRTANLTCPAWAPALPPPPELSRLLDAALCRATPWPDGSAPHNRSAACLCVARAWQAFEASVCGNGTDPAAAPDDARAGLGDRLLRCMDRTPQYELTAGDTDFSRVFPTGVAFYSNGVLFLASLGCWLFFGLRLGRPTEFHRGGRAVRVPLGQLLLFGAFAGLCVMLLTAHPLGNALNAAALLAVYLNLAVGLHEEEAREDKQAEDELDMAAYATLPQLLPAHLLLSSVAGFGRDLGAYLTAMGVGALLGLSLKFAWLAVGHRRDARRAHEQAGLLGPRDEAGHAALATAGLVSALLYVAHWAGAGFVLQDPSAPYLLSRAWPSVVFVLLLGLWGVGACDALTHGRHTGGVVLLLLAAGNLVLTGLACRDAALS